MSRLPQRIERSTLLLLRGLLVTGILTAICVWTHLNAASMASVYLIAVVLLSLDSGFAEAAIHSVIAVLCLDYFFIDPLYTLSVDTPADIVTLSCLLIASLVTTRIQARRRMETQTAQQQRAHIASLHQVSQKLLSAPPQGLPMLEPFLTEFHLTAICIFDGSTHQLEQMGDSQNGLASKTRECYVSGHDASYEPERIVVRRLQARDVVSGAIGFEGLSNPQLTAPSLSALAAAALETARAFRAITTADAQAQAEMLRSAILDALAHEIKTPLATIATAAGGLRENQGARGEDVELAETIETEALRLADLTTRLLRLARLDREEVTPRLQATDAGELAVNLTERYSKMWPGRRILFHAADDVGDVRADPELLGLALSQLIENACRYSAPESVVLVELGHGSERASITVWNEGEPIDMVERHHIFERFYRGTKGRTMSAGTGLGLFVARKIALAHGGNLNVVDSGSDRVGFRLTIPLSESETPAWQTKTVNC